MPVIGEFGVVDEIICREDLAHTVHNGEPTERKALEDLDALVWPDNCPRGPRHDAVRPLGCITCVQAEVYFLGGRVRLTRSPLDDPKELPTEDIWWLPSSEQ